MGTHKSTPGAREASAMRLLLWATFVIGMGFVAYLTFGDDGPCRGANGLRWDYCVDWVAVRFG
jgi:hypothetical protein